LNDMIRRIEELKKEKDALILAHFYQPVEVQQVADIVGDSFELARRAVSADAERLVLCGVRFMAESAKILNPDKKVLLPVADAGCPMADTITAEGVRSLKRQFPDAAVVCYVNSSASVKAESDICCTSSSAERVIRSLKEDKIIFIPDRNLGRYMAEKVPEKQIILYSGCCPIHDLVRREDVLRAKAEHPGAPFLVHPECRAEVVELADVVGSTKEILDYIEASDKKEFLIGTELGVVDRLKWRCPDKTCYIVKSDFICADMKKTGLEDLISCLENDRYEIELSEEEMNAARASLERMIRV